MAFDHLGLGDGADRVGKRRFAGRLAIGREVEARGTDLGDVNEIRYERLRVRGPSRADKVTGKILAAVGVCASERKPGWLVVCVVGVPDDEGDRPMVCNRQSPAGFSRVPPDIGVILCVRNIGNGRKTNEAYC